MPTTLGETCRVTAQMLVNTSDSARLDAELLIAHALAIPRARFISNPEHELSQQELDRISALILRRSGGEPVAYILGHKHFWDLDLMVTPDVLIPRPDTELLVEAALELFTEGKEINLLDLGTGSGAIAIALARAKPEWHVSATDDSRAALAIALENAETYRLHNLSLLQSHWFEKLPPEKSYDLILSNPPYIPEADPHLQQGDVRFEPRQALVAGSDGLDAIRHLIPASKAYLKPDGWLMLEHGYDQGDAVRELFARHGYQDIQQKKDLGGHVRVTLGRL